MKLKLAKKPEIYDKLEPRFRPGCRRLTPGPGFLEALVEDNVHFTTSQIVKVTKDVRVPTILLFNFRLTLPSQSSQPMGRPNVLTG
jgi:hypothetical protein